MFINLFFLTCSIWNVYANTYCVHNVHNSSIVGRGVGVVYRVCHFIFLIFGNFHIQKGFLSNNRSKINYQNCVKCNNVKTRAGEPEPVGAGCFRLLGAGAAWKKTSSRSRLEKKSGAGAAKKISRLLSPARR